jgi:hypothetical protein
MTVQQIAAALIGVLAPLTVALLSSHLPSTIYQHQWADWASWGLLALASYRYKAVHGGSTCPSQEKDPLIQTNKVHQSSEVSLSGLAVLFVAGHYALERLGRHECQWIYVSCDLTWCLCFC